MALLLALLLVGLTGFEPATFGPPDRRANQAAPQPATPASRRGNGDLSGLRT